MCPLSATMQFFVLLVSLLLLCHHAVAQLQDWELTVKSENATLVMFQAQPFEYKLTGPYDNNAQLYLTLASDDDHIAFPVEKELVIKNNELNRRFSTGNFSIMGSFLGYTKVTLKVVSKIPAATLTDHVMNVKVIRETRLIDTIFTSSVATLVSIIYINFGCALNWSELRTNLKRPIGPTIGFVGQFVIMPLLSFGLGKLLFPGNAAMQLGMFFTGISPGGGASNVWVAVLDGNIDLSITMTAISTLSAFGMIPFWVFTLGRVIFQQGDLDVPYRSISTYAVALIVPLAIGYLIQRFAKRVANFFVRILKVFSSILILFIIIFAIVSNLYIFELFSWQIVIAGMGLPWLGYGLAYLLARLGKQKPRDALTIAVETGIQNTGIAIFLLRAALDKPESDLTTVAPVAVATMTPIPLLILFAYIKIRARCTSNKERTSLLKGNTLNEIDLDNNTVDSKSRDVATIS